MPMSRVLSTHTRNVRCVPYYPGEAKRGHFNVQGGVSLAAGTVVGKYSAAVNAVKTITDTPTITAGTFTLSGTHPVTGAAWTTAAIDYDATAAETATAVQTAMGDGVTVTGGGGALPGTDVTLTFTGTAAGKPVGSITVDNSDLTGGTLAVADTTAGRTAGTIGAYVGGGSTDPAIGILEYTITSRSDGTIVVGENVMSPDSGEALISVPVYLNGSFHTDDLTGLDAGAITDMNARQVGNVLMIAGPG